MAKLSQVSADDLQGWAQLLVNSHPPNGWEMVASSNFARVAHNKEKQIYYKEFLPRSPIEKVKALIKGSRGMRARKNSDALRHAGFNAPINMAWGSLPKGREYLITRAVHGEGVDKWIKVTLSNKFIANLKIRRQLLTELGIFIGRLHATGFIHGDLRTSNVLAHRGNYRFEFSLIDNERNRQQVPVSGKQVLRNLMQLNMHVSTDLSRTDRLRFFRAWHSQMRVLSPLEAKVISTSAYQWAVRRLRADGKW